MSSNTQKTILLLAANPKVTNLLRLDEEVREIDAGLQRALKRDQFVLERKWAVRPRDIQRAMLDTNPSIVHFSGHGTGDEGLVFEDETGIAKLVDGEALAGLFELFAEKVECVVLNGCYSEVQASAIARHVNYVIGMNKAIGDRAAIEYAVAFYDALGAGRPVEFAHKFGCAAIPLAGIPEQLTPVLKKKPGMREIEELPLENIDIEQMKQAYLACCPDNWHEDWKRPIPDTHKEILDNLVDMPQGDAPYSWTVQFVARLLVDAEIPQPTANKLKAWGEEQENNFSELLTQMNKKKVSRKEQQKSVPTYLIVLLQPSKQHQNKRYFLSA